MHLLLGTLADFLGHYLTEPKPHVFYEGAEEELEDEEFIALVRERGVALDLKSLILYADEMLYCNGERLSVVVDDVVKWQQLANARYLAGQDISATMIPLLLEGYHAGWWEVAE